MSDDIRAMIAVSAAKHHVALRNVAPIAQLWLSTSETHTADGVSAGSVMQILMNVYTRVWMCMAEKIAKSEHIAISIDGTSDVRERNPIAIRMTGVHNAKHWSLPVHFCEPGDHKAATQLSEIERVFNIINEFNEGKKLPKRTIVDIEVIVFDTTSSNTGMSLCQSPLYFFLLTFCTK